MQALVAHLDEVIEHGSIAANAQRDLEAEEASTPPAPSTPAAKPTQPADTGDEAEDEEDEDEEETPAESAPASEPEPSEPAPAEPPKYSRRDAARFAEMAQQREREANEARQIAERASAELGAHRASDQTILTALGEISGYTRESNGRFRYENLRDKVVEGTATDEERTEVAEMTQWQKLAGPIYRHAERQITGAFAVDWNKLKDLEGVGESGMQVLNAAENSVKGAAELHRMAFDAGKKAQKQESDQTIAKLRGEIKQLKNGGTSHLPQPAVAGGNAVPATGGWRDRAFGPDGLLTDEFDREVRAGKWLGVDLANQG